MNGTEHESHALPAGFFARLGRDTADAIVYADPEGRIRFWNRGAEAPKALRKELAAATANKE